MSDNMAGIIYTLCTMAAVLLIVFLTSGGLDLIIDKWH